MLSPMAGDGAEQMRARCSAAHAGPGASWVCAVCISLCKTVSLKSKSLKRLLEVCTGDSKLHPLLCGLHKPFLKQWNPFCK